MLSNTQIRYGAIARLFHWTIALGILAMIALGWLAHLAPMDTADQIAAKTTLFSVHKTLGIAIFFLALARILWALVQPKPVPLHPDRKAETLLAETVHWLLYGSLVLVPLTGWIEHAATDGFAPIWWPFGQSLPFVPKSPALAETFAGLHFMLQWLLVGAIALHVAGALKHAVIDRDATLARMARGAEAGAPGRHAVLAPLAMAVLVWAAVLGGSAAAGLFGTETGAAPTLEQAESDWQVQEGTLGLRVTQMGREVEGSFADWTAAIAFEPQDAPGKQGEVQVQIALPSLTLGSVTKQALGPDFLDAEAQPTATFVAEILRAADGYEAVGTLTLKDRSVPVTLPFSLTLDGETAQMTGRTTLDRREFAVGDNMTDPEQLGFEVEIEVDLTAARAAP